MKKIGIISLYGNTNYGNKLQNYAVQHFFKTLGLSAVILRTPFAYFNDRTSLKAYLKSNPFTNFLRHFKRMRNQEALTIPSDPLMRRRYDSFLKFSEKHLTEEKNITDTYNVLFRKHPYDYYVVGSDQVWNYRFGTLSTLHYLRFVPYRKRWSISASLGDKDIPAPFSKLAAKYMKGMRILTVREESGKALVERLTGREATLLLDPTLLIGEEPWKKIEERPDCFVPEKYVFTYFLDEPSPERRAAVERFVKENHCSIVAMNDPNQPDYFVLNPSHFIYLIHHAQYVITDSFHGTAFSVLYRKNFMVLKRGGAREYMIDRVVTLLNTLHLKDRLVTEEQLTAASVNYNQTSAILHSEREKARSVFRRALEEDQK